MSNLQNLGTQPVGRLLWRLSLPACAGLLSIMLYNLVDTIFIGHYAGSLAIAGISVVLPIAMLLPTLGMSIGIGSSSVISRALGAKDYDLAQRTFGNALSSTVLIGTAVVALCLLFTDQVLSAFGARGELLPYARVYYSTALLGIPFLGLWMCLNNILRAEGHSRQAMIGMWFSSLLNVALDAWFIVGLDMGLKGAAVATVISQICGLLFSLNFYYRKRSVLRFSWKTFWWESRIIKEIFALGSSSLARQGASSIMVVALNYNLYLYSGAVGVAVYGVLQRIFAVLYVPSLGVTQGFLPVAGFNYGARNYARVKEVALVAVKFVTLLNLVLGLVAFVFPEESIRVFTDDPVIIEHGVQGLRIITLFMALVPLQLIGSAYFQAVGKARSAMFLSMTRQIFILIPLIFILGNFYQMKGVWLAFPVSDALACLLVMAFLRKEWKKLNLAIEDQVSEKQSTLEKGEPSGSPQVAA